jgi:60 kDa SS-A/Ro ribonucleoprotein
MSTTDPLTGFSTTKTHQQHRIPGRHDQVKNNAGGYVFEIDPLAQLTRFLTMGSAGGTFYVGESELTSENGNLILAMTKTEADHRRMVDKIVEISLAGRAMKQNPTLFALAIACQHGTVEGKQYARAQITKVARTGTHLFLLVKYLEQFGGWSMGLRKAVAKWYTEQEPDKLAYQLVKYRSREGWTHRDVLRKCHPSLTGPLARANVDWAIKYQNRDYSALEGEPSPIIRAFEQAWKDETDIPMLISDNPGLPWEGLPDEALTKAETWDRLLDNGMPINALLRQLPRLTNLGIIPQMGGRTQEVIARLLNPDLLAKARIHPFQVLLAMKTYASGQGMRSSWTPTTHIVDALDEMYYRSFGFITPTGMRTYNALDVSGSMGQMAGGLPLSCREVAAALAITTVRTEENYMTVGFTDGTSGGGMIGGWGSRRRDVVTDLPISPRQRLDDVVGYVSRLNFGGTDCALPMIDAVDRGLEIDTFVIYTDNETWHGGIHPSQALQIYRQKSGIDARLVVVSITPTKFSIADPKDPGMLDISGFDAAVPQLISAFSAREI